MFHHSGQTWSLITQPYISQLNNDFIEKLEIINAACATEDDDFKVPNNTAAEILQEFPLVDYLEDEEEWFSSKFVAKK